MDADLLPTPAGITEQVARNVCRALVETELEVIEYLTSAQNEMLKEEQVPIFTEHVLHGGMYARTITMPPWTRLIGAYIKVPTIVVTVGEGLVSVGMKARWVRGYQVIAGSAKRKQAFVTLGQPLVITAMFPTQAKTVAEAEAEFTDEAELLLSRRQDLNKITITEEQA